MSSQQANASNSASLRPRNRRLISLEGDSNTDSRGVSPARSDTGASSTSYSTRTRSPLPSTHPSRSTSTQRPSQGAQSSLKSWGFQSQVPFASNTLFSQSYWENSWSNIQGIASTLLGSDASGSQQKAQTLPRKSKSSHAKKYSVSTADDTWGRPGTDALAAGTNEEQLAIVQAKKRERLLLANGESRTDSLGRHKRRVSVDPLSPGLGDELPDTRVYVHHVQKGDTLAGLSIRYNCPQAIIQKANRLWSNDSIQLRRIAYLPVDSCGIRGRKVPTPKPSLEAIGDSQEDSIPTPTLANPDWTIPKSPILNKGASQSSPSSPALTSSTSLDHEPPHVHDSWISVDHIPQPIEIARMPHRSLGFFPPARRKSVAYTDTSPPRSPNPDVAPTTSPSSSDRRPSPRGRRRGTSSASASAYYLKQLRGPGGVGSLNSMNTRSPGPPRDKLNELVSTHLPILAAPRSSFESVTSASSAATNLGELGGRVEGWVRKIATKKEKTNTQGDLIELVENWDSGGPGIGEAGEPSSIGAADRSTRPGESSARAEEERLLRERFPIRGRVFEEQPRR